MSLRWEEDLLILPSKLWDFGWGTGAVIFPPWPGFCGPSEHGWGCTLSTGERGSVSAGLGKTDQHPSPKPHFPNQFLFHQLCKIWLLQPPLALSFYQKPVWFEHVMEEGEPSWDGSTDMQRENKPKPKPKPNQCWWGRESLNQQPQNGWKSELRKKIRMTETENCAAYYFYCFTN